MSAKLLAAAVVALLLAASAAGGEPFLTPDQAKAALLLPPPPEPGSPRAKAEIEELEAIAAARTPAELDQATRDAKDETGDWFAAAVGPQFDFAKLPKTAKLLADVHETEEDVAKDAKTFFHRDRPWIVDPKLATCTPHKDGPAATSYPSGHATTAFAMAVILARLMPGHAQAILKRAEQYAEERLVCSVHFRSDIEAGQQFGTLIGLALLENPSFRSEYDAAAAELTAARLR